jgi:Ran GTPase-activating protein (RanGAP) involved in mRNA processing and transport
MSKTDAAPSPAAGQVSFLEELYVARCKDTLERPSREEFLRFNSRLKSRTSGSVCSLRNQHLGVSAANILSKFLRSRTDIVKLDLSCNLIRDHGLQVISHLLHLNPSIRVFNIGCNDLSDKAAPILAEIASHGHVTSLQIGVIEKSLHPNRLTAVTLDALSEAIVKCDSLRSLGMNGSMLSLSKQPTQNAPSPEEALIRMLSKSHKLRMLRLSNCQLRSKLMMNVINFGLRFNTSLARLDVSCNGLKSSVGIRLAHYLLEPVASSDGADRGTRKPHLFALDVGANCFGTPVANAFARVMTGDSYLGYLDLSSNQIDDEGVMALSRALETNQTLVELHLAANRFTAVGGKALAGALRANETLMTLDISQNKLGDETACEIADALQQNTALTALSIASALLSNHGGIRLAQAAPLCPTLVALDMSNNFFTEDAGSAMEKLFGENTTILKVDVSGTQINYLTYHALDAICARNTAALKLREQRPLLNQLVKSQYSVMELERKEAILGTLVQKKDALQEQIDRLDDQIEALRSDEDANTHSLAKQIQDKEQQIRPTGSTSRRRCASSRRTSAQWTRRRRR